MIAATNRDLDDLCRKGSFRSDLLFRLRTLSIEVPPLRERTEDIRELAFYFLSRICDSMGTGIKGMSPEFLEALADYHWPGNVRELSQSIEAAVAASGREPTLFPVHLPTRLRVHLARASMAKEEGSREPDEPPHRLPRLHEVLERTEKDYLLEVLERTEWNVQEASRISGLSRTRLYTRLSKYGITRPD